MKKNLMVLFLLSAAVTTVHVYAAEADEELDNQAVDTAVTEALHFDESKSAVSSSNPLQKLIVAGLQKLIIFIDQAEDLTPLERYQLNREVRAQLDDIPEWAPDIDPEILRKAADTLDNQAAQLQANLSPWDKVWNKYGNAFVGIGGVVVGGLVVGVLGGTVYLLTHRGSKKDAVVLDEIGEDEKETTVLNPNANAQREKHGVLARGDAFIGEWIDENGHVVNFDTNPQAGTVASSGGAVNNLRETVNKSVSSLKQSLRRNDGYQELSEDGPVPYAQGVNAQLPPPPPPRRNVTGISPQHFPPPPSVASLAAALRKTAATPSKKVITVVRQNESEYGQVPGSLLKKNQEQSEYDLSALDNVKAGACSEPGDRSKQEDRYYTNKSVQYNRRQNTTVLHAVFDGHGGEECPAFVHRVFHNNIRMEAETETTITDKLIESVFQEINFLFKGQAEETNDKSGSTAVVAFIHNNEYCIANIGDSRAYLGTKNKDDSITLKQLTVDHKPSNKDEETRVQDAGGLLMFNKTKLNGVLEVTRSFGDFEQKGISAVPAVMRDDIKDDDIFLLLCSDGLTDVMTDEHIASLIRARLMIGDSAEKIASMLTGCAIELWKEVKGCDNVTAVYVPLQQASNE